MKKFYLFLGAVALAASANAKQLTFYLGDTPIVNGSEVYFSDIQSTDLGGLYDITMAPELYVVSDVNASNVKISAECTSEQTIQLCAGGSCEMGTYIVKENVNLTAGVKLPLEFHYAGFETEIPEITTEIDGIYGEEFDTYTSFTIVMGPNASLAILEHSKDLRSVPGAIRYTVDGETPFCLYSTDGAEVLSTVLDGEGTLSTSSLRKGIYVYTLGDSKGKLYIH